MYMYTCTLNDTCTCSSEILVLHQDGTCINPLVYNKAAEKCPKMKLDQLEKFTS